MRPHDISGEKTAAKALQAALHAIKRSRRPLGKPDLKIVNGERHLYLPGDAPGVEKPHKGAISPT